MKTRERNKSNKRTEIERFVWFIERIRTLVSFGWLSERLGEKKFVPENCPEINRILRYDVILQHDWPIEQCLLQIGVQQRQRIKNDVQNIFDICKVLYIKKISLILKTAE